MAGHGDLLATHTNVSGRAVRREEAAYECELVARWQDHADERALENLLGRVRSIIRTMAWYLDRGDPAISREDLEQVGTIGAIKAITSYDPSKGLFRSWVTLKVRSEVDHLVRDRRQERVKPVSLEREVERVDRDGKSHTHERSLAVVEDGFEQAENATLVPLVRQALTELMAEERQALEDYYARGLNQYEIAEKNGYSQMQASRLLRRGLGKLQGLLAA